MINPKIIGDAAVYCGDSTKLLPRSSQKVDLVITSPPYATQRDYGQSVENWDQLMQETFRSIPASDDCQILVNLGLVYRDFECVPYWNHWIDFMRELGWRLAGWYVWDQGDGLPGNWRGRLAPSFEFVFHFNKQSKTLNKWKPCKRAGETNPLTSMRKPHGKVQPYRHAEQSIQDFKIADSVIRTYRQMARNGPENEHPAVYPVKLCEELLLSFTQPGDVVLDPFMGSGTTGVACLKHGRRFIGIDIEPEYVDIACERLEITNSQLQMDLELAG